jgi:RimJ/RimL family protein N-acetyltransferase
MSNLEKPSQRAHVTLRSIDEGDIESIISWRNDPATRSQSRRQHELTWNDLVNAPNGGQRETLVAVEGRTRVGYVHLDRHDGSCELSWVVAPAHRGKGVGTLMVEAAIAVAGCDEVTAEIRSLNKASIRIAERCGFVLIEARSDLLLWRRHSSGVNRSEPRAETPRARPS